MAKFTLTWISILALPTLFSNCSTRDQVLHNEQRDFLKTLEGQTAEVVMSSGKSTVGSDFSIYNDSLFWWSPDDDASRSAALSDVNAIVTREGFLGGVKGFLLGAAAGTATFALIEASAHGTDSELVERAFTGLGVAGVLVIGGTIAGIIIGHPHEYMFVKDEPNDSRRRVPIEASHTRTDVLYLINGDTIRGIIIAQVGDEKRLTCVAVRSGDGTTHTYYAAEFKRIEKAD